MAGPSMFGPQPVNFFSAMDPGSAQQQMMLQQQQALAQHMMEEGAQQPDPTRSAPGGWVVPYTAGEGLTHAGKQMAAALMQRNITKQQADLSQRQMQALVSMLRNARAPTANPMSPQAGTPSVMAGSGTEQPQITADQAPSNDLMSSILPIAAATQLGGPQAGEFVSKSLQPTDFTHMLVEAGFNPEQRQSAYTQHFFPPLNVRPEGTVLQNGQPIFSAPKGGVQTVWTPQGPVARNVTNAQELTARGVELSAAGEQRGIQPYSMQTMKVPVYLPGGDQTVVEMNAPQAEEYNRTGRLPPEIAASIPGYQQPGQQPQMPPGTPSYNPQMPVFPGTNMSNPPMSVVPPQDRAAFAAAIPQRNMVQQQTPQAGPARPVAGRGQTQAEQITQTRQTAAGKAVDEQFAKDYVNFTAGGGAQDAMKQLAQLDDVAKQLANPKSALTGPIIGSVPDMALKFTGTGRNAIAMRERVEEVVQRSLRAILGAQFTEKEGERLIARAYNPNMNESENSIRVNRLMAQLHQAFQTKQDAARYFEKNGTLQGWEGKLPTMNDFEPEGASPSLPMEHDPQAIVEELRRRGVIK